MTNSEKKTEEIIEVWTNLKSKLSKLVYFSKKKELIKEALEVYLNQSSSFLSEHNIPPSFIDGNEEKRRVYQSQKEKNIKIVKECKELLEKLEE